MRWESILQMCVIIYHIIHRWIALHVNVEHQFIWWSNELICFQHCCQPMSVHFVQSMTVLLFRSFFGLISVYFIVLCSLESLNLVKPPHITRTVIRSRYSLAYPQAQALATHQPLFPIENPYPNPNSPYEYTGSAVNTSDYRWLSHDIEILMRSG